MAYSIDLHGQTAIVTGGVKGIGRATCRRLAEAGADIVLDDILGEEAARPTMAYIESVGRKVIYVDADVGVKSDVERLVSQAIKTFGKVDILVNNAGVVEDWERTLEVNMEGPYNCSMEVIPHMVARGSGRIINIISTAAVSGSTGHDAYVASKGALYGLTRYFARNYADKGILVNGIMPAVIKTDMLMARYKTEEALLEHYLPMMPIKRVGTPEDIANVVLFLCSELSSYIAGEIITADGGREWIG